jgi:hypothetical protein
MGGRKPRTEEQEIIAALDAAIPLADVLDKLRRAVLKGEDWAVKLYLAYYWHLPTQRNEVTGAGGENLVIRVKVKPNDD